MKYLVNLLAGLLLLASSLLAAYTPPQNDISGWNYTTGALADISLQSANFSGVTAVGTLFGGSIIDGRPVSKNLSGANFANANLSNASFYYLRLNGTVFTDATISGANFSSVKGFTSSQLYSTANYKNKDLQGILLRSISVANWDFSEQDLSGVQLSYSTLSNAIFTDATISGAIFDSVKGFTSSQLYSTANYKNKDLQGIVLGSISAINWDFSEQNLNNARFSAVTLSGASFVKANLSGVQLSYSTLSNAIFTDATISGAIFNGAKGFTSSQLYSTANYKNKDLQGISLRSISVANWDFSEQDLSGVHLGDSTLSNAIFTDATISGTIFDSVKGFTSSQLYSTANYKNKDLQGIVLGSISATNWDFSEQNLNNARFSAVTLSGASFVKANLSGASFAGSTLSNAIFTDATISGADFSSVKDFTSSQLYSTASYKNKDLHGISFPYACGKWDFSGQDLSGANFYSSVFTSKTTFADATISGANFHNASNFSEDHLYSTASYKNKDLQGVIFTRKRMAGWNFSGQNLSGAYLDTANLGATDFSNANLSGAHLGGSTLSGAIFTDATISGAELANTTWTGKGFTASQLYSTANYKNKDLQGVDLSSNLMRGWSFFGQNLSNTNLSDSSLEGSIFVGANLINSNLSSATLSRANFTNADLRGADLANATGSYTTKNTIGADGTFLNFSMQSSADNVSVRKYTPLLAGAEMIAAKIADSDARISGGAVLTLEEGAQVEVSSGASLSIEEGSGLTFEVGPEQNTQLMVKEGGTLTIANGMQLVVNLVYDTAEVPPDGIYTLVLGEDNAFIMGADSLVKNETVFVYDANGQAYKGNWDIVLDGNSIAIAIPEPSACIALFGLFGLACAVMRRRW